MTVIKDKELVIEEGKTYTLTELVNAGIFKVKAYNTAKNMVLEDLAKGRGSLLKADIRGDGKGRRIYIKGANLIKYFNEGKETKSGSGRSGK